ncbi:unnamed protein product [Tilletia laevis]|uniref:Uncharacterized protein n=1 Tax=Tilletia laevis TaxID=157183 RepID=A0A9N8M3G1_9BASI|nr:unnamed protein product [Tilletia laevis]CAD6962521.1 unnamed protein product [Tilletia laevis]CAD6974584.1 unnamed protein product [Tilletia controversa]
MKFSIALVFASLALIAIVPGVHSSLSDARANRRECGGGGKCGWTVDQVRDHLRKLARQSTARLFAMTKAKPKMPAASLAPSATTGAALPRTSAAPSSTDHAIEEGLISSVRTL